MSLQIGRHFINQAESAVEDFIQGLLLTYPNTLQQVGKQNVVIRRNIPPNKVTLLSGGGSGHEPSHAGWIGDGMLDGAILGGMFASPSVKQILAGIRAVTPVGAPGCLLIVKNYTGDRLNFGMACEMANAEGRKCRMVIVADDCAIPRDKGATGARGVCGTVLVHKVAGAAAAEGLSLGEVVDVANYTALRIGSLGASIGGVVLPGQNKGRTSNDEAGSKVMELGIGIHGEAGIQKSELLSAKHVTSKIINTIVDFGYGKNGEMKIKAGDNIALVLNNLGGTSNFEMGILSKEVISFVENSLGCHVSRFYVGSFMTSFDMHGISISMLCLDDRISELLDKATNAPAWSMSSIVEGARSNGTVPIEEVVSEDSNSADTFTMEGMINPQVVDKAIRAACTIILENEEQLTKWDLIVGDGDCGITMKRGATEILQRLENKTVCITNPVDLCLTLADAVSQSMGGTSGILFELFFRKMAGVFVESKSKADFTEAFKAGVDAVMFYGGAKAGYRTMLDALIPAAACMDKGISGAAEASVGGANSTAEMKVAMAGRSNYLSEEQLEGTPDPGAKAVSLILCAIASSFS